MMTKKSSEPRKLQSSKFFEKNLVFAWNELVDLLGGRTAVTQHVQHGRISSLGSGYYSSSTLSKNEGLILAVARYYPQAVLSGASALFLHGLIESDRSLVVEADIERSTNLRNKSIRFRRVSSTRKVGVTQKSLCGRSVNVYDVERSLAECFLQKWPKSKTKTILKKYLEKYDPKIEDIREYDQIFGTQVEVELLKIRMSSEYLEKSEETNSPVEQIVTAALQIYCAMGSSGLTIERVASESGLGADVVRNHYVSRKELEKAVYDAFANKVRQTGYVEMFSVDMSPKDFIRKNLESFMAMSDADENGYKFQRWAVAEASPLTKVMFEDLCSAMVQLMKEKIMDEVPGISSYEAEARAIFLGAVADQYTSMRWYYSDLLKTNLSKHEILRSFKMMILDVMVPAALLPPNPLFKEEVLSGKSFPQNPRKYRTKR